jgi:hypothetical protein
MSDDILHPGLLITLEEVAVVTCLPLETVSAWLEPINDRVTLREALFVAVVSETAKLKIPPEFRVLIAHTAATEAIAGSSRIFVVCWEADDRPSYGWVHEIRCALPRSVHLIPVEFLFNQIAERLVCHRAAAGQQRPN